MFLVIGHVAEYLAEFYIWISLQLAAAAEIDEEPVSKAKQSRSEKKARKVTLDVKLSLMFSPDFWLNIGIFF